MFNFVEQIQYSPPHLYFLVITHVGYRVNYLYM